MCAYVRQTTNDEGRSTIATIPSAPCISFRYRARLHRYGTILVAWAARVLLRQICHVERAAACARPRIIDCEYHMATNKHHRSLEPSCHATGERGDCSAFKIKGLH